MGHLAMLSKSIAPGAALPRSQLGSCRLRFGTQPFAPQLPTSLRRAVRPAGRKQRLHCSAAYAALPNPGATPGRGVAQWLLSGAAAASLMHYLPVLLLGVGALALAQPHAFTWFHPAYNGQQALMLTMCAAGLSVSLEDLKRVLRSPGCVLDGLALQYAVLPTLALMLIQLLALPPEYAVGLLLVSCCPGGSASAVVAQLAGGDVPLNVMMTTASVMGASVATPLLSRLLLGMPVAVDGMAMAVSTLQVVLLPLLAGVAIREVAPEAVAPLRPLCTLCAAAMVALSLGSYVAYASSYVAYTGAAALRASWPRMLAAVVTLHAAGFALGYSLSRGLGLPESAARSHSIQAGGRNSALAAQLAFSSFPTHPLAAVPCALSACVHTALGGLLAWWWVEHAPLQQQQQQLSDADAAAAVPGGGTAYPGMLIPLLLTSSSEAGKAVRTAAECFRAAFAGLQTGAAQLLEQLRQQTEAQLELLRGLGAGADVVSAPPAPTARPEQAKTEVKAPVRPPPPPPRPPLPLPPPRLPPQQRMPPQPQQQRQQQAVLEPPPQAPPRPIKDKRPANPNTMNIVMVGSECAPWSKTGGLGDVMQALPKALAKRGHRVMVVAPHYKAYEGTRDTGVRLTLEMFDSTHKVKFYHMLRDGVDYVFVDHPAYKEWGDEIYGGTRPDVLFRCAMLTKAALEAPCLVPCGSSPYGDSNLLFVANDWHTALLPVYLQAHYRDHGKLQYARSVLVLHNMAHQGRGPLEELRWLALPESYEWLFRMRDDKQLEHMNVMKAGAITAHRIVAVSDKYAEECQTEENGWGLDGVLRHEAWKLRGVVNGIDCVEWDPATDAFLQGGGYTTYDMETLAEGKARCKAALQKELGLPVNPDAPLLGFIGRLDFQKGVDLIAANYEWLMEQGAQVVLLGCGREDLEAALKEMQARNPKQCRAWVGFSVKLAHRITAGCDLLLMPSRFEPCGLNQLYAMAYGTPPVVHAVGGLHDTVKPFNPFDEPSTGTGWNFYGAEEMAFREAMTNAMYTWRQHPECFRGVQLRGMSQDLSWDHAAEEYETVLLAAKYQW